jgi:ACR3 family arsenite transporter
MSSTLDQGPRPNSTQTLSSDKSTDLESLPIQEQAAPIKGLGYLDRFLALWILLAMAVGILLGNFVEEIGPALQKGKFVGVSIPIAIGLLVMMYPILCKVRYETLHRLFRTRALWVQIVFSIVMNWVIAPLLMVDIPPNLSCQYYTDSS